jgi:predicted RNase H-like HicB family nuclease
MRKININLVKLLKGYKSGWVGISSDFKSVLVSGKSLTEARKKASKTKEKIYFFPAGESYSNFIG